MATVTGIENKCQNDSEKCVHKSRKENCNQTFFHKNPSAHSLWMLSFG